MKKAGSDVLRIAVHSTANRAAEKGPLAPKAWYKSVCDMAGTSLCCQVSSPNNMSHAVSLCHHFLAQVRVCRMNLLIRHSKASFQANFAALLRLGIIGRLTFIISYFILNVSH